MEWPCYHPEASVSARGCPARHQSTPRNQRQEESILTTNQYQVNPSQAWFLIRFWSLLFLTNLSLLFLTFKLYLLQTFLLGNIRSRRQRYIFFCDSMSRCNITPGHWYPRWHMCHYCHLSSCCVSMPLWWWSVCHCRHGTQSTRPSDILFRVRSWKSNDSPRPVNKQQRCISRYS